MAIEEVSLLKRYRLSARLSLEQVAQKAGTTKAQVHKLENGERRLTVGWINRLAPALDCEPVDLLPAPEQENHLDSDEQMTCGIPNMLPVYDLSNKHSLWRKKPIAVTSRPANMLGSTDGFAVYMHDDSISPRFSAGEILFIKPEVPVSNRSYALIELETGDKVVAQIGEIDEKSIKIRSFNPASKITLDKANVLYINKIVGFMKG